MKTGLIVSLGCAGICILCALTQAAVSPDSGGAPEYVVEHWESEFLELEKQIKAASEIYGRGGNPYEGMGDDEFSVGF